MAEYIQDTLDVEIDARILELSEQEREELRQEIFTKLAELSELLQQLSELDK